MQLNFAFLLLLVEFYWHKQLVNTRSVTFGAANSIWNKKYYANYSLQIINNSVYADMYLRRPIIQGAKVYLNFQTKLPKTRKYYSLLEHKFDFCQMIGSMRGGSFLRNWFKSLKMKGNVVEVQCPIPTGLYTVNGWRMETAIIPILLQSGEYLIEGRGYYGKFKGKNEDLIAAWEVTAVIL